jgi:hypothetical protein
MCGTNTNNTTGLVNEGRPSYWQCVRTTCPFCEYEGYFTNYLSSADAAPAGSQSRWTTSAQAASEPDAHTASTPCPDKGIGTHGKARTRITRLNGEGLATCLDKDMLSGLD